ncbi:MAG: hypothetical protein Q8O00_13770, partial [Holophaga sp.]|nr:hypothetical protein [Holophaga sp.]
MNTRMAAIGLCTSIMMAASGLPKVGSSQELFRGWAIQAADKSGANGAEISSPGFSATNWLPTTVPSTVMAALVQNGIHKAPLFGKNLDAISPEPFKQGWWYRTEFTADNLDPDLGDGTHTRLRFDGLNYRADIWLNGKKIANRETIVGAFRTFDLEISTGLRKGVNALAVEVFPPQPGDFTMGFVDWNPLPPDRNMGIFREVKLNRTAGVAIEDLCVRTQVNLKTLKEATLEIGGDLVNLDDRILTGTLKGAIGGIHFQVPYTLKPRERKALRLSPEQVPALRIRNPRLWWPHTLGKAELYTLKLSVLEGPRLSDTQSVRFGIRQVGDYINEQGHRGYTVN